MHILWVNTELLHPIDKGGRIRTYHLLRELRRAHRITYLALDDSPPGSERVRRASEYCDELVRIRFRPPAKNTPAFYGRLAANLVSSELPYVITRYHSPALTRAVDRLTRTGGVDLVVCDFLASAINIPATLPCPALLFQHNVEAIIWERHAAVARDPVRRRYLREQSRRMSAYEARACRRFDHVVAVSPRDADTLVTGYGLRAASHVDTGVDTAFFRPLRREPPAPRGLVFTGSMDWMPNEDAILFFTREILPRIRSELPDVTLAVVGRSPGPALRRLAARDRAIRVTGAVPDIRPELERAAVVVVPLRVGGGTRIKIFEAMAMEKPIVSSTVGAEGLPVEHGRHLLLADTPASFARAVVELLREPDRAAALGRQAAELVRAGFGWDRVAEAFARVCLRVVEEARPAGRQDKDKEVA